MQLSRNILLHVQNSSEIEFAWSKVPDMIDIRQLFYILMEDLN